MTPESGVWLGPSVTHIEAGRAAAFRVPGVEEDQKGRADPREIARILLNFSQS